MNKVLWMTDVHMKHSNLSITKDLYDFVLEKLQETSIKNLVISGDLMDTKALMRAECVSQLRWFCWKCQSMSIDMYVLVGNHDMVNSKDMKFGHSLEFLKDIQGVRVIDEPMVYEIDSHLIKFIPYTEDNKLLSKELKNEEEAEYLFCHNGIAGAQLNVKGSFDETSLSAKKYKNFRRVYVGHYHNCHVLEDGDITYLGSPFSHSFAESNQKKYIGIISLSSGNISLIEPGLRSHIDVNVNSKNVDEINVDKKEEDFMRVFLKGTKEDNKKAAEKFKGMENVKLVFQNEDRVKERIKFDLNKSKGEILKKYLDNVKTTLDKKKLEEIGKSIVGV